MLRFKIYVNFVLGMTAICVGLSSVGAMIFLQCALLGAIDAFFRPWGEVPSFVFPVALALSVFPIAWFCYYGKDAMFWKIGGTHLSFGIGIVLILGTLYWTAPGLLKPWIEHGGWYWIKLGSLSFVTCLVAALGTVGAIFLADAEALEIRDHRIAPNTVAAGVS